MEKYRQNASLLAWFSPFRTLSISAAYLTPFFIGEGLNLSQILLLQSVFSVAVVLLELPSGYIADRFGRAVSIRLSAPLAAISMIAYGLSGQFWQFLMCEIVLAVAYGLISGADKALLYDSLKAAGQEEDFVRLSRRIDKFGFAANAVGVPISAVLVTFVGLASTLIADGLLVLVGLVFTLRLTEPPRYEHDESSKPEAFRSALWKLACNAEVRWLIVLGAALSTSTYLGFWFTAPYYAQIGVPVVLFGTALAVRNGWKAWLAHRFHAERRLEYSMFGYALAAGLVYAAMASGQLWLVWAVLAHDVIHALHNQPISDRLNGHFSQHLRATMNSVVNLIQRLVFAVAGPLAGLLVDKAGLSNGFLVIGAACSSIALLALMRLRRYKTFGRPEEERG